MLFKLKRKRKVSIFLTFTVLILMVGNPSFAQWESGIPPIGQGSNDDNLDDLKSKIKEYEKKIKDLLGKEKTLQNQIDSLDDQIELIQLKIKQANKTITQKEKELIMLEGDIGNLSVKIDKLSDAVNFQSLLFNERVKERYKSENVTPLELLFSSNISELVQKIRFIKAIEDGDKRLIGRLRDTKKNYEDQKTTLEGKKAKVEEIKKNIEIERANAVSFNEKLSEQKADKNALLSQTKGDEAVYQELLRKAKAEVDAIEGVVSSTTFENGEAVDKGDFIAVTGNSGYPSCSTGAHLHFEVRKNGSVVNAENYLKSKTLYVDDYSSGYKKIGSGKWDWPMLSPQVTQRYGKTPWSYRYPSGIHTGVDMVSSNTKIYAPEGGKFVRGTINCYGSKMNYAAINHGSGVVSYYFHIK